MRDDNLNPVESASCAFESGVDNYRTIREDQPVQTQNQLVSAGELQLRAAALVPMLKDQAAECERQRQVSVEVMRAIQDAELLRAMQPARFGGFEHDFDVMLHLGAELGRGCGSTGWVFGVLSDHQWMLGLFPFESQVDVWGEDPRAFVSASYAPSATAEVVQGGYRLSGKWGFASGCDHASWHMVGALIPGDDGGPPRPHLMLVPHADYRIEDDWFSVGLAGSGSKDVILDNVFVPAHRAVSFASLSVGGALVNDSPLYQLPFASVVTIGTLSTVLGITRGAIESFLESARTKTSIGGATRGSTKVAESVPVQQAAAAASAWLDAAELLVQRDIAVAQAKVSAGETLSVEDRVRCRRDYAMAAGLCVRAVNTVFEKSGARGMHLRNPVQRCWRDVNVAARHVGLSWDINSLPYGRYALGLDPKGQY